MRLVNTMIKEIRKESLGMEKLIVCENRRRMDKLSYVGGKINYVMERHYVRWILLIVVADVVAIVVLVVMLMMIR